MSLNDEAMKFYNINTLRGVCMGYRHDFPLLSNEEQFKLIEEAKWWGIAWHNQMESEKEVVKCNKRRNRRHA